MSALKRTELLAVGMGETSYKRMVLRVESYLIGWDIRWQLGPHRAKSFEDAVGKALATPELDLVYIVNAWKLTWHALAQQLELLGATLTTHPNRPDVVFYGPGFNAYGVIFRRRGIHIHDRCVEEAAYERWENRSYPRSKCTLPFATSLWGAQ